MIELPKDFDRASAAALLSDRWRTADAPARDAALARSSYPAYEKFLAVAPKTLPTDGHIVGNELPERLEAGDPAAFDVAMEALGMALPSDAVVETARGVLACKPWKRLRNLAFEAVARLDTEESFRFLLGEPFAVHLLTKNGYEGGERLAIEKLASLSVAQMSHPMLSRAELAKLPVDEREAVRKRHQAISNGIDPVEHRIGEDLVSYLGFTGSEASREWLRRLVTAPNPDNGLRSRAALGLLNEAHHEDLASLVAYLDDPDALIRSAAIRAVLLMDPRGAWKALEGDRLLRPGSESDADEVLYELGRDLAGTGGVATKGWARIEPRFVDLARHWLPSPAVRNAEFVLRELGEPA